MKIKLLLLIFLTTVFVYSQPATEVYLFDLIQNDSVFTVENPVNISKNKGYDNQPSFLNDGTGVLFASTRDNQTDIVLYNLENQTKAWLTSTLGNEYSPIQTPYKKHFTAIRLEGDGTQLLWMYPFSRRKPKVLIENLTVGYHAWYNKNMVVAFVLGDPSTLQVSNLKFKIKYPIEKNIGRSIHKIPETDLISYISLQENEPEIYSINPVNSEKKYIADALIDSQDMVWTPDGTIIMGKENKLFKLKPGIDKEWIEFASLESFKLNGITRIAISPLGNKIAIVVDEKNELNDN
ncbi:MAG: hypothetical protein L3J20_13290 [Flavobacteriaceae bacterium]|nr:hypothetical protein [Flavobacteriaceae bacterium]